MLSPYREKFKVTQDYKPNIHKGIDLVGVDSKNIYSTVNGIVEIARWENANNTRQGFGQYVMIKEYNTNRCFIYAHLSKILVSAGQKINKGELIGIEGNTGHSFGSHCHYEVRQNNISGNSLNINEISGIPNGEGKIYRNTNENNIHEIALKVIEGVYGNGEERKQKLGNLYNEVQNEVNRILGINKPNIHELALKVINGDYGNGEERKQKLGNLYNEVQKEVNRIIYGS